MMTDKTIQEESQDQPAQESKVEQPVAESQDQPTAEVVETEEAETLDAEDSEVVEIDGVTYTPDELREYVNKGKDYTKKTQQLAEERRRLEESRNAQKQPATEEDTEITQAKATLRKYNVAFAEDVDEKIRQSQIKGRLDQEFEIFQRQKKLSPEIAALVRVAGNAYNIPYEQAYDKFWGNNNTQIVKRKIVGAKKSALSPVQGRSGGGITRAEIAAMDSKKYKQLVDSGELDRMIQAGEIK
jgi:hypothetical protein